MIQGFKCHAAGNTRITHYGNVLFVFQTILRAGKGHAQCGRDCCAAMTHPKGIVGALLARWETTESAQLSVRMEIASTTGQDFMAVGLVPNIPDQQIFGRIKDIM